jgi:hypothetical protein
LRLYPEAIAGVPGGRKFEAQAESAQDSLGVALKDGGQFDEALRLFEAAKLKRPEDPFVWRQVGYVNGLMGRSEQAMIGPGTVAPARSQTGPGVAGAARGYHAAGRPEDVRRVYASCSNSTAARPSRPITITCCPTRPGDEGALLPVAGAGRRLVAHADQAQEVLAGCARRCCWSPP